MIASKVTFMQETKSALLNPVLDKKKKSELRLNRVYDYIRQQPAGTAIKVSELVYAAGFDAKDENQYQRGWAFLKNRVKNGAIIKESIPNSTKAYYYIPKSANTDITSHKDESGRQTIHEIRAEEEAKKAPEVTETPAESSKVDEAPVVTFTRLEYQVVDVEEVRRIENLAREFSWNNDSDSLREFIKSLK